MRLPSWFSLLCVLSGCVGEDPQATDAPSQLQRRVQNSFPHPSQWDDPLPTPPIEARSCQGSSRLVEFDSRFSTESLTAIQSSWAEWKMILSDHINDQILISDLSGNQSFESCVIKVILHDPPPTYLGWTVSWLMSDKKFSTSRIWIPNGLGDILYQVSTHEFGHALGVPHSLDPTSVMNPVSLSNSVITCEDKKNLCNVWGCVPGCE